ncbi:transcriptional adapter 3-like [Contarinia nasturtii]|uniref:transcriptional adapter 3-like n=1 Tax=Contarinia nasturtii TaxID=265458 RepID=UPI0012D471EB|nr:transcriptional adapter 3-like [Contarinia nasturtii]
MSSSPAKHKSSHHHHHHHHRDHQHPSSSSGHSSSKSMLNLSSYIKIQDSSKVLPRYSVALSKPHDECLPMDELDGIQTELETLLSSVATRYRTLKSEYDSLEDRKYQKKSSDKEKEKLSLPSTSGKRKREEKKSSSKESSRHIHAKHAKTKNTSSHLPAHGEHSRSTDALPHSNPSAGHSHPHMNPKPTLLKNDVPYKFWLSVEPYCIPITQEDIKLLDDLIDEYSEPLVPSIPDLGPHYTVRWAAEDLRNEQANSNANVKPSKRKNSTSTDVTDSPKKSNEKLLDQGVCGSLTQRLVSALLEDNEEVQCELPSTDATSQDENHTETNLTATPQKQSTPVTSLLKSGIDVENRLKKELLDLGILEPSDFENKDDEVLNEINRVRNELEAIAEFNRDELKLLKTAAKGEMKRQEIKRKIDRIDKEIIDAHKRVLAAKQKRRPLSKHERTDIYRLVEEQKRLSDLLESMPIPGFNYLVHPTDATSSTKTETASNTSKS